MQHGFTHCLGASNTGRIVGSRLSDFGEAMQRVPGGFLIYMLLWLCARHSFSALYVHKRSFAKSLCIKSCSWGRHCSKIARDMFLLQA